LVLDNRLINGAENFRTMSIQKSYNILDSIRLPHGLYLASPSVHYSAIWIRDALYISLPFLNKPCNTYERAIHRLLDLLLEYEWKIDIHTSKRPRQPWEYIHGKYDAHEVREIQETWGNAQHDAIGLLLWSVGAGEKAGKRIIRNERDKVILQKLVNYLQTCEYWVDDDNGMWEEEREIHASSVGACVSGLRAISGIIDVAPLLIHRGLHTLDELNSMETFNRLVDLSQLSLIYPHKIYSPEMSLQVVEKVEQILLRKNGVIRYQGDSYYSTLEMYGRHQPSHFYHGTEAEWCLGLPWLAICRMELGDYEKAAQYIQRTEEVMMPDGSLPELYYANTNQPNPNTPLGWANALYLVAKEQFGKVTSNHTLSA
jgi:phosphorylase kinase alpha/beta subunit